jgi:tetratricopeptide (TPR) repeat protein
MTKDRKPTDNVIRFPTESLPKFGLQRVKKRRESKAEQHGQLNLFTDRSGSAGDVVKLPTHIGPFDEALLLDERGEDGAADTYRRAISEGDCVADAYCNLGVMESRRGRKIEAFDCFKNALKHDPRHFESHFNLGNLYFEAGELRPALLHYEVAAGLDPEFPNVYFNLGVVSAMVEDFAAALKALTHYKDLAPEEEGRKADDLLASLRRSIQHH